MWKGLAAKPQWRCLIPVTHFAEAEGAKGSMTRTWVNIKDQPIVAWGGLSVSRGRRHHLRPQHVQLLQELADRGCIEVEMDAERLGHAPPTAGAEAAVQTYL